jgi:uncharacterized protein YbaR (Trm112 family)
MSNNFESEFVSLVCPQCGGKVSINKNKMDDMFFSSGKDFVFIGGETGEKIVCEHCKTEFVRKQSYQKIRERGNRTVICSGAYIEGSVNLAGGDFIGGDLIINKRG